MSSRESPRRLIINKALTALEKTPKRPARGGVFSMDSRYLEQRETRAGKEMRAWQKLTNAQDDFSPISRVKERTALKELRRRHSYCEILTAFQWLFENGTFPDRQRCLFPLSWLAAGSDRMRAVLHRAHAEMVREYLNDWRRELISERKREQARADRATDRAIQKFTAEYPTPPERMRAMIRVFNIHREKFGTMTLEDPAARALCIAFIVTEIEALEMLQEQRSQAG